MKILVLFFIIASFSSSSLLSDATSFNFRTFTLANCRHGIVLRCMGSVTSTNGHLSLTPDTDNPPATGRVGRVLYRFPVTAWPRRISTTFTVNMRRLRGTPADGLTFIMAPDDGPSPANSAGGYLGVSNDTLEGNLRNTLAVELDTFKNPWDMNANHVAVITRGVKHPLVAADLNRYRIRLASGRNIRVQINYSSRTRLLTISMGYTGNPLRRILSRFLNLSATVPSRVFVGFTASTGNHRGTHRILNWSFNSTAVLPRGDDDDDRMGINSSTDDDDRMGINNSTDDDEQPMPDEDMIISEI